MWNIYNIRVKHGCCLTGVKHLPCNKIMLRNVTQKETKMLGNNKNVEYNICKANTNSKRKEVTMVRNADVAKAWADGRKLKTGNNYTHTDGINMYSYNTIIAHKINDNLCLMSSTYFSSSTSKHQSYTRYYTPSSMKVIFVPSGYNGEILVTGAITRNFNRELEYFIKSPKLLKRKPNRHLLRELWNNAVKYDSDVSKFISDETRVKVTRMIAKMKQD